MILRENAKYELINKIASVESGNITLQEINQYQEMGFDFTNSQNTRIYVCYF